MQRDLLIVTSLLLPVAAMAATPQEQCLLERLAQAPDATTVAQLRAECLGDQPGTGAVATVPATQPPVPQDKTAVPQKEVIPPFLTAYHPNYVLPLTYAQHRPDNSPYAQDVTDTSELAQKVETKFQLSLQFPIASDFLGTGGDVVGAYTQRSFWQMYNSQASRPFRETNYEPEFWYQHRINTEIAGWNFESASLGLNHQSNGRGQAFSRSWNRVIGRMEFVNGPYTLTLRPWWRIKEDAATDDNPDINHYLGNFDLNLVRDIGSNQIGLLMRNNLQRRNNRATFQLDWTFPLWQSKAMRGYVQWFNGYGESLIDYKVHQNTVGVGVKLVDW